MIEVRELTIFTGRLNSILMYTIHTTYIISKKFLNQDLKIHILY